ncbi:3,4-dihydroxy-2-butanone-4-phosphate synthase [Aestuariivirga litoralis]|uniref:3,4-dihydroxy-2-butanone 4-phosphate synthase n=1 Tax=Aestuariivirga litoralis TaxID=2650924 RepID=A0A2W2BC79_9HYPH|nr:3,4-dihydroxy-2-butanone-4-phosphate synthase [Aestuariivirga litoralis]PZF77778.1 3,4-dihydroxy-2-butanone-4-phosphate synthase [Aestuariivirga litoralis]
MKLSEWLANSGTSQSELARRLGVTQGRVSQLVAGALPSLDLANKIAAATGNKVRATDFGDQTMPNQQKLDLVEDAIKAIAAGEMVVVVDDDDRENEGDLIGAAAKITPEQMAFMVRHTSGIVCTPITAEDAKRLKLDPMVALNDAPMGTAFTVTIDYKEGLTTGISAKERAATCHALANRNVVADDFVRPGHIFPLVAKSGGVLMRSGHTEAAVDLVKLAGLHPAGVICELVNDDGSVKRGPQVMAFAREHGFKIISVADLIAYRQRRERLVEQTAQFDVETAIGKARGYSFVTPFDQVEQLALVFGDVSSGKAVPVRLHRENVLEDVFGTRTTLSKVFEVFKREGAGILVYLQEGAAGVPAGQLAQEKTGSAAQRQQSWRDVGLGAQILRDLNVSSIRLVSSSNRHYVGLSGFGIEIAETIKLD